MGTRYLIDTSGYSRYLDNRLSEKNIQLMDEVLADAPDVSIIVKMELLSYRGAKEQEAAIDLLLSSVGVIHLSDAIVEKTIEIRRKTKIKLPDAIIAATALVHRLVLLSCNDNDFLKVPKLKYKSLN